MDRQQPGMDLPTSIRQALSARREMDDELLQQLVEQPSQFGQGPGIQQFIQAQFEAIGLECQVLEVTMDQVANHPEFSPPPIAPEGAVVSVFGALRGTGGGRSLLLFAHYDTAPLTSPEDWQTPPLTPTVKDGRMYGLGTADSKAGIVSIISAAAAIREAGVKLHGDLTILSIQGKGGGIGGLTAFSRGPKSDVAIYSHPAETGKGLAQLKSGSRGLLQFQATVTGKTPEPIDIGSPGSGDPRQGVNAVEKALIVTQAIGDWARQEGLIANLGSFQAGDPVNARVVPDHAVIAGSVWFQSGTWRERFAELTKAVAQHPAIAGDPWLREHPPVFEVINVRANPAEVKPEHPLYQTLQSAVRAVTGQLPEPFEWHAASDIRVPMLAGGMPCIGLGPVGGNFYGPNEWVDLESMHQMTEVLTRTAIAWCGQAEP